MKCDLHVHTLHSGMCTVPLLDRICRESYNPPEQLYETLKRRGMDLVTVTDHDSIDASEALRRHPDFFLSEEISCTTPSGTQLHVGVYDISERQHVELQRRRNDLPVLIAYLKEQRIFFAINHVFSSLTGPRTDHDFALFEEHFPAIETRNGQMLAASNVAAAELAARWQKACVAGSDSHTRHSLGLTYSEVPEAQTRGEFLQALRSGIGEVHGVSGNCWNLTRTVLSIGASLIRERPWAFPLVPLMALVPFITLTNSVLETRFTRKWAARLHVNGDKRRHVPRYNGRGTTALVETSPNDFTRFPVDPDPRLSTLC